MSLVHYTESSIRNDPNESLSHRVDLIRQHNDRVSKTQARSHDPCPNLGSCEQNNMVNQANEEAEREKNAENACCTVRGRPALAVWRRWMRGACRQQQLVRFEAEDELVFFPRLACFKTLVQRRKRSSSLPRCFCTSSSSSLFPSAFL